MSKTAPEPAQPRDDIPPRNQYVVYRIQLLEKMVFGYKGEDLLSLEPDCNAMVLRLRALEQREAHRDRLNRNFAVIGIILWLWVFIARYM